MEAATTITLIAEILARQGKTPANIKEETLLREINFRSLDFAELCLRAEELVGKELEFDAGVLRGIKTVKDVCDFFKQALKG